MGDIFFVKVPEMFQAVRNTEVNGPVIVFCHGLMDNRLGCSSQFKNLCSYGFTVYSFDFQDGSAIYAQDVEGKPIFHEHSIILDLPLRKKQLQMRVEQLEGFLEEQELKDKEVILMGHSFGGATALMASSRNKSGRIKACCVFDPWTFPMQEEILN